MPSIKKRRKPFSQRQRKWVLVVMALISVGWLAIAIVDLLLKDIGFGIAYAVLALMWTGLTAAFGLRRPRTRFVSRDDGPTPSP
jgi:multidrug transporter EmrE-like cation transporter